MSQKKSTLPSDITIYEPLSRANVGFFSIWPLMIKNIITSKDLIIQLFKRDFFAGYKKSFLGYTWIFISPVLGIVSWVFMNATGILKPGDVGVPYPAYVLISTSIFGLFGGFYGSASGTLGAGAGFIMQVKYPHEALLLKQTAQYITNFTLSFASVIAMLLFFKVVPDWKIVLFPIMILPLFFLGASLGLVISVINVVAFEVSTGVNFLIGLLAYATPVIYSPKIDNPLVQFINSINPLTYLIGVPRDAILYGKIENLDIFLYCSAFSLIAFLLSWRIFYLSEHKVIEKMI